MISEAGARAAEAHLERWRRGGDLEIPGCFHADKQAQEPWTKGHK